MNKLYKDPDLYKTCIMCNVNQHLSGFRFKTFKCRLSIYLHRYGYKNTKNRFKEYTEKLK